METQPKTPKTKQEIVEMFQETIDQFQKKAFQIAEEHLKDTFDIVRSNAFQSWWKEKKDTIYCTDEIF